MILNTDIIYFRGTMQELRCFEAIQQHARANTAVLERYTFDTGLARTWFRSITFRRRANYFSEFLIRRRLKVYRV
jgi:hypothetical protein